MLKHTFLFLLTIGGAFAQTAPETYRKSYDAGLKAIQEKRYEEARQQFTPLTLSSYQNDLVPYSHYFLALADLRTNKLADSRAVLRQLEARYPSWNKLSDARLLYANILLEEEQYQTGIDALKRLTESRLGGEIREMEAYYLGRCTSLPVLRQLQVKYPADEIVAQSLVNLIYRTSTNKTDLDLAARLTEKFKLKPQAVVTVPVANTPRRNPSPGVKKTSYNVGVLFPFKWNDASGVTGASYTTSLYEGMRMAVKKLQTENTTINLVAYDVDNTAESMTRLVNNGPFQQLDLLIGPLYPQSYEVAAAWAAEKGIPIVNPLSTSSTLGQNNTYLAQPSVETQAKALLKFAGRFIPKTVAIAYGTSRQDSLLATTYAQLAKDQGYQVVSLRRSLTDNGMSDLNLKKPGHFLAVFSTPGAASAAMSWFSKSTAGCPILLPYESFNMVTTSPSVFAGQKVYLFDSLYPDDKQATAVDFRQKYMNRTKQFPSTYAYLGYDTVLFFGRLLGKYGTDISKGLTAQAYRDGYTLGGFDYRQSHDNQNFTVLQYSNYQFTPVR